MVIIIIVVTLKVWKYFNIYLVKIKAIVLILELLTRKDC